MSSKTKKFSAINDFINPDDAEKEIEAVKNQLESSAPTKALIDAGITKNEVLEDIGKKAIETDPEKQGFVRWTTYIKPKYKKFFKMLAVEEETDIYKLLDLLLEEEFKKKNNISP